MGISTVKTIFHIGPIPISNTIIWTWVIFGILTLVLLLLSRNLKLKPTGKAQLICEYLVDSVRSLVKTTMGEDKGYFGGYFFTIAGFLILSNLSGFLFLGIVRPPTADLVTTLTLGIFTFLMCQGFAIKTKGIGGYLKTFLDPFPFMLPLNIISEMSTPVSLAFRLFGNIFGGMVITGLIYSMIAGNIYTTAFIFLMSVILNILIYTGKFKKVLDNKIMKFIGIILMFPSLFAAFGHAYFDIFAGLLQTFIFCMLSMVFVSQAMTD